MSRLLIGGAIALFMALTPALAEDAPASGANTTPAAKEKAATAPSTVENSDAGKTGGGGGCAEPEPEPVALGLVARAAPVAELAVAELAVAAAK